MHDESHLLKLARRCRDLEKTAIEPEIIEQLRIWATELAGMAEDSKSQAVQLEMADCLFPRPRLSTSALSASIWPTATTLCPSRASPKAIARPKPRNPPVTIKSARGGDDRLVKIAHFEWATFALGEQF